MAKKAKQETKAAETPVAKTGTLRLPLPEAKTHNSAFAPVASAKDATAANVALTSKGTNPKRVRVYGYDNAANNGGVPKDAVVAIVAGATGARGVPSAAWEKLVAEANGKTVAELYGAGVPSRTVRRAYRAGSIRFVAK